MPLTRSLGTIRNGCNVFRFCALLAFRRQEAREHQRRLMQGLGRPIISFESNGYRLVAVGNEMGAPPQLSHNVAVWKVGACCKIGLSAQSIFIRNAFAAPRR
jgi:hypothetical protein